MSDLLNEINERLKRLETHFGIQVPQQRPPMPRTVRITMPEKVETTVFPPQKAPEGPIRDETGRVVAISAQVGRTGYDKDLSAKEGVEIWCGGIKVENAHTADARIGVVEYYEKYQKNGRDRIRTKEVRGEVEIKGL